MAPLWFDHRQLVLMGPTMSYRLSGAKRFSYGLHELVGSRTLGNHEELWHNRHGFLDQTNIG